MRERARHDPLPEHPDTHDWGDDERAEAQAARGGPVRQSIRRARGVDHLGGPGDGRDGPPPLRASADLHHQGGALAHRPGARRIDSYKDLPGLLSALRQVHLRPEPFGSRLFMEEPRAARERGAPGDGGGRASSRSSTAPSARTAPFRACLSSPACRTSARAWSARRSGWTRS